MALIERWVAIDLREDVDLVRHAGDPGELIDAGSFVAELVRRPAWHAFAACRGRGPDAWFPSRGHTLEPARAVCATCPVTRACLAAALAAPSMGDAGVWAGTSERERRRLRRTVA